MQYEKERKKEKNETFSLALCKIYAILIMHTRRENAQREVIALSITLMTGAEMGVGWTAITMYTTGRPIAAGAIRGRR